jgi:uncharacterized membrane protein
MMALTIARVIHVVAVVAWIGGVGFVTTVLFPAIRRSETPEERLAAFIRFETPFAWQACLSVAVAGLSGLYMTWRLHAWDGFASPAYWWMDAMVGLWLIFAVMLFVLEPLVVHRRIARALASGSSSRLFDAMQRFHRVMLALSVITVVGAVGGSHGLFG